MTVTVMTPTDLAKATSRAAAILHPYSVDEAEAVEYSLDQGRQVALDELRRCEYLAGDQ